MSMYVRIAFFYLLVTHSVRACALNLRLLNFMEQLVSNLQPPYNPPFAVRCPASPNPPVPLAGLGTMPIYKPPPAGGAPGAVLQFPMPAPQGNMGRCLNVFQFQWDQTFMRQSIKSTKHFKICIQLHLRQM